MWKCIPNNWVTYGTCHLIIWQFPHIIIHHHLQAAVVSHGWAKASACRLQITVLCCPLPYRVARVFVQVVSPPLGWSPLSTFLAIIMVSKWWHARSLWRLICPAQDHFIFLTVYIISMTFVLSLTKMLVLLSLYVMLSILLSIWSVRPQVCSVLVWSVSRSLHHMS